MDSKDYAITARRTMNAILDSNYTYGSLRTTFPFVYVRNKNHIAIMGGVLLAVGCYIRKNKYWYNLPPRSVDFAAIYEDSVLKIYLVDLGRLIVSQQGGKLDGQ